MTSVLILLATYNGERFLSQQLDSLYLQENVDFHILARDDGSKDGTLNLLRKYSRDKGKMTIIEGDNVGAAVCFFKLIQYAVESMQKYDYYAFCDQDDVWYSDKLDRAVRCLGASDNPLKLYFSMAKLCDANDNIIGLTNLSHYIGFYTVFFSNPALGCTQVLTYDLLKMGLVVPYIDCYGTQKKRALLHDEWIYDIASFADAFMVFDNHPTMNYRQHGANVTTYKKSWFLKYKLVITRAKEYYKARYQEAWLLKKYENMFSKEKQDYLNMFCYYRDSWYKTFQCACKVKIKGRSFIDRILFKAMILTRIF